MKAKKFLIGMMFALCLGIVPAMASVLGDIRGNARFLTDRMAFELSLTQTQYNDLYEVNYDFFHGIDPYVAAMARQDAYALDAYYRYLDERNDDLRWVLSSAEYARFMALEYFFRPVYAIDRVCYLRIYKVYPNRTFFYYGRPAHYLTYCGGHSRHHFGGRSFYKARHPKMYRHPVYAGGFRCRPDFRKHDFAPERPPKGPGYHFTPSRPPRPEARPERPGHKPDRHPQVKPSRPDKHPAVRPPRPDRLDKCPHAMNPPRPDKKPMVRPSRPDKRPEVRLSRPERKPQSRLRPERKASKERGDRNLRRI